MSLQLIALLTNIALAILKFSVGLVAGSRALLADAFNSAGDVVATLVAWVAFRIGRAPADEDHHYGHDNAEALAGLLVGGMLCATGAFICIEGVLAWFEAPRQKPPEMLALWAALITAVVKEALYRASIRVGRATHSPTLMASARDHRADVLTSLVAAAGVVLARYGYPAFDDAAGGVIGIYIFFLGIAPIRSNLRIIMAGASPELAERAGALAALATGVDDVRRVQVLPMGGKLQIDLTIAVDGAMTVTDGHDVAHRAEDAVRAGMPRVTEVRVHVEPREPAPSETQP